VFGRKIEPVTIDAGGMKLRGFVNVALAFPKTVISSKQCVPVLAGPADRADIPAVRVGMLEDFHSFQAMTSDSGRSQFLRFFNEQLNFSISLEIASLAESRR
jgi:hypothetical protein